MRATLQEIETYLARLFPIHRSITGEGNRQTLRVLQELVPLTLIEYASGTRVYDWEVPPEWHVEHAFIETRDGKRLVDLERHNLHLVSYSIPLDCVLSFRELAPHLHVHPTLPEALPYRTSYYRRDWGFCVTHAQRRALEEHGGPFRVRIDSTFKDGSLSVGERLLSGQFDREVLISAYICHPSMANDSLSGVLTAALLARELERWPQRRNRYRIVFVPETIGAISYCAHNEAALRAVSCGLVVTTCGGPGPYGYKQSWNPRHPINALIEQVFRERSLDFVTYPFDIHGSDERQYSSAGFRINVATISKDKYYEYPAYHSSHDDLTFVRPEALLQTLELHLALIEKLEQLSAADWLESVPMMQRRLAPGASRSVVYRNRQPCCEPMLSRHDLYPTTGGAQLPGRHGLTRLDLILWLLFHCDGSRDLAAIAQELGVPLDAADAVARELVSKNLLEEVDA